MKTYTGYRMQDTLAGCNFSLCLFCVAVISKNNDNVEMQKIVTIMIK